MGVKMMLTSSRLTLLLFILLTTCLCNTVASKRCESSRGHASRECSDDDYCCETNGEVQCCTAIELWWVWTIIAVSLGILIPLVIFAVVLCCCIFCAHKRSTHEVVHPVRTLESSFSSEALRTQSCSDGVGSYLYKDAPPSYADFSKYLLPKSPPPYPGA